MPFAFVPHRSFVKGLGPELQWLHTSLQRQRPAVKLVHWDGSLIWDLKDLEEQYGSSM